MRREHRAAKSNIALFDVPHVLGDDLADHVTASASRVFCHGVEPMKQVMGHPKGDDAVMGFGNAPCFIAYFSVFFVNTARHN